MNNILKKILPIFLVLILLGCAKDYKKSDIQKYVKTKLYLSNTVISNNYITVSEKDYSNIYYNNKIWTVTDKENDITFHIKEETSTVPAFGANTALVDDYSESVFLKYYDDLDKDNNIVLNTKETSLGMNNVVLECNYKNKKEIKKCLDSLSKYNNYYLNKGFNLSLSATFSLNIEKYNKIKNIIIIPSRIIKLDEINEKSYDEVAYQYFRFGLENQFDDILSDMNDDDIKLVMNDKYINRIFKISENNEKKYYENLITPNSQISIGTLYIILNIEKYNISGTLEHYSVITSNNDKYEFSYDFSEKKREDFVENNYYLKNGEKVSRGPYFSVEQINEMFNINLGTD